MIIFNAINFYYYIYRIDTKLLKVQRIRTSLDNFIDLKFMKDDPYLTITNNRRQFTTPILMLDI